MRIIADENVPAHAIELFRIAGHDVLSVHETALGSSDGEVLRMAIAESRILITHYKSDFGWLIFLQGMPPPPGVILFRIPGVPPEEQPRYMADKIAERSDWAGFFWVIGQRNIRQSPFAD